MSESAAKRERHCSTEKDPAALLKGSKRICLPIERAEYSRIVGDPAAFRQCLDSMIVQYPELFPPAIAQGYQLHDLLPVSKKMPDVCLRRIKVAEPENPKGDVFTIVPSFVLPYMTGYTDDIEKALFLRGKFGVPYWALTYVFGHNDRYWEHLELGFGRNSIVGTTVKRAEHLPQDLLADEKHTRLNGETVYVATTVGNDCVLGASVAVHADEKGLTDAYQQFKTEAQNVQPDYQPKTVNTDGWLPTHLAWKSLFANITLIVCFLHAFLKIRDRCTRMKEHFSAICKRVWDTYHATSAQQFTEKCEALKAWASATLPAGTGLDAILKLCARAPEFLKAYEHPTAHRTSNMLDRLMDHMDRRFYSARYFHGHLMTAEYAVRAGALLANFQPYCPRAAVAERYQSPAHKLNGFVYHDNWLHNLLISASMGGYRRNHRIR
jgi:hypothetical protein